jgi:hypothetical protein
VLQSAWKGHRDASPLQDNTTSRIQQNGREADEGEREARRHLRQIPSWLALPPRRLFAPVSDGVRPRIQPWIASRRPRRPICARMLATIGRRRTGATVAAAAMRG